jgi:hypothetical protein
MRSLLYLAYWQGVPLSVRHTHTVHAMFGPFLVSSAAGLRRISSPADAAAFIKGIDHTSRPPWRIASRMLEWAWMSAADEEAADMAFRNALEIDGLLHE